MAQPRHFSENSAMLVDKTVKELLSNAEKQAIELITKHRKQLDSLIDELEKHETLDQKQIMVCFGNKVSQLTGAFPRNIADNIIF